jgi:hypothetical protein
VKPVLQALILADRIYRDVSGKHIIAGTFNKMVFAKGGAKPRTLEVDGEEKTIIPGGARTGSPYVYVSLTEIRGKIDCALRYVSLKEDKALFETRFSIECDDPLETVELVLPMPELPHLAGVHALEFLCDNEPLGSHRVLVEEAKEDDHGDDSSD